MAILSILRMGHPILRQKAHELSKTEILSKEIQLLLDDMTETMRAAQGLGLAAPQVGFGVRLAIVEIPPNPQRYPGMTAYPFGIYINPKVKILTRSRQGYWEGCLSVPGIRGYVERPKRIELTYLDRESRKQRLVAEGFPATVFQHEFDHLDGKLFVDRVKKTEKLAFLEEYLEFHNLSINNYEKKIEA